VGNKADGQFDGRIYLGETMCRILVVDDHPDCSEAVSETLRVRGHDVITASDGAAALAWFSAHAAEPPCLIVLDLRMPSMDGWDFLETFRTLPGARDIPVIVHSAVVKRGEHLPALRAQAYWPKPADPLRFENIHEHCALHRQSWPLAQGNAPSELKASRDEF
jgi:CheY-like chemotaxis protein